MSAVQFSVLLTFAAVGIGGLVLMQDGSGSSGAQSESTALELEGLRADVAALSGDIRGISQQVQELSTAQMNLSDRMTSVPVPIAGAEGESTAVPSVSKSALKGYVAAVLDQEREVQAQERERRREEEQQRREEREREVAALREGPFENYNYKINSLGKELNLDDGQKQAYFELATAYSTKLEEGMKQMREKMEAAREAGGEQGDRRGGWGRGGGEEFRKLITDTSEQFKAEVQQVFTEDQFAAYGELSRDLQGFSSRSFGGRGTRGGGGDRGGRGGRGR